MNLYQKEIDKILNDFENQPKQFMSEQKKQERPLMAIAMADKTFTVTFSGPYGGTTVTDYTGTLELEGNFAVIREWKDGQLIGITVLPSHYIIDIKWKPAKTVKI